MTRATQRDRRGFTLLMVLIVLTVLSAVLVHAVRSHQRDRLAVHRQVEALQTQWLMRSVGETLTPLTSVVLDPASPDLPPRENPPSNAPDEPTRIQAWPRHAAEARRSLPLRTATLQLVAMDEQAKLNVNTIAASPDQSAKAWRSLTRQNPGLADALRFRPFPDSMLPATIRSDEENRNDDSDPGTPPPGERDPFDAPFDPALGPSPEDLAGIPRPEAPAASPADESEGPPPPRFGHYGQLFRRVTPRALVGDTPGRGLASHVTPFGDGQLNARSVGPAVVRAVAVSAFVTPVDSLYAGTWSRALEANIEISIETFANLYKGSDENSG
ncbi:MAG: hypothetical protein AAGE65_05910, partial [Planctomycetota bacterium]